MNFTTVSPSVWAASHREAPLITLDPTADITDVSAFVNWNDPSKAVFIMNVIPAQEPSAGLGLLSGVIITILGVVLVVRHYRGRASGHSHEHEGHRMHGHHRDHVHGHEHTHRHHHEDHVHHHATASPRELLTQGISGAIVPCPAALVVLLSAVALQRTGFGLLLIVAFSAGLAAVLIAIGLLMVYARRFMCRIHSEGKWVTRWLPMTSSAFIVAAGVALTWQAWRSAGLSLL